MNKCGWLNKWLGSNRKIMRFGIYAEIAGILVMSSIFVIHIPLVMVFAIPLGLGLMGLGLLSWLVLFIKTL